MKQAIIVRKDLKMRCGKIAGQVAHASQRASRAINERDVLRWIVEDEPKIILKVNSEISLIKLMDKLDKFDIPYGRVNDLGKTQIEADTLTCIGIGPLLDDIINSLVGDLKLL